jgi:glutamate synthase (NADPH/NADH) large chain
MKLNGRQGMYDSAHEKDSCGIGFVANIKGKKSHSIVHRGLEVLERMEHRGAESADNKTGDGAGILTQIPDSMYREIYPDLPAAGKYAAGIVFLPRSEKAAAACVSEFEKIASAEGVKILYWRDLQVDSSALGDIAREAEPLIRQVFAAPSAPSEMDDRQFDFRLYVTRKQTEKVMREHEMKECSSFYIASLSRTTILYKGMLMPYQLRKYYADLRDENFTSAIALVHSRFSTNTFPSWELAQPFRMLAHNGEINTVKGNRIWMKAREGAMSHPVWGDEIKKVFPVIEPGRSDSASFDNALELLVMAGRSLPHAIMMLIPESWNEKNPLPDELKDFYHFHSAFMEPWDGPASMVFTDGRFVGGTLDRNGLRPSRYYVTKDGLLVMGSEVGVQNFPPEDIEYKGRLLPGKLLFVDTVEGRIIPDAEVKRGIYSAKPYGEWIKSNCKKLADLQIPKKLPSGFAPDELVTLHKIFGYNREDIENQIKVMAETGQEPTSSMGTDVPLAVLSEKPQRLFNYFKQVFAQVTNPPIDPIREELVMTLTGFIGPQLNLLAETPQHCSMIKFLCPIFTDEDLAKIKAMPESEFRSAVFDMTFDANSKGGLEEGLENLCRQAEAAADNRISVIVLSDRFANASRVPIPSLLACAAVHHHLIRAGKRMECSLIMETAEAREVMHFALLYGYGASAVNPYAVFATIKSLHENSGLVMGVYKTAEENFIRAIHKGVLKIMSKMGTSTLRSYRGAQIFEAVGLSDEVIEKYFTGTDSRLGGIGLKEIEKETRVPHKKAFAKRAPLLESEGVYRYRKYGEKHAWNPETIHLLQWSTRTGDYQLFKKYSAIADTDTMSPHFIRGLFEIKKGNPVPIEEVESAENIMKRLTTGAMSFGSLSAEVHEAMAVAMNSIGGRSNSGEGGEDPARFAVRPDGTSARSSIKQVASGRFGVTSTYLANADEIQIKIAQGAKPGEGGQLPGHKVDKIIARTRHSTPGVTLISPPPHHDIYSIEDLKQLIFDLKNANPNARISVKLVSESGVGTIAAGVAKAHADNILISGFEGGTGASPQSSIKHAGLPWELGLAETHQTLMMNNLRSRVRLQTDGQLKTGRDIAVAAMLGAEEFGFGTSALIVLGCVMMRKCHMNTCPVGVATQDPELRKRFKGQSGNLVNYFRFMAEEVREIMASVGVRNFNDLVGRTDLLEVRKGMHSKASALDPSPLLFRPDSSGSNSTYCKTSQVHKIDRVLDRTLIERSKPALADMGKSNIYIEMQIKNTDRAAGTMLSYEISSRYGDRGLPDGSINCTFRGSAGQSFAAFLAPGVTFRLEGDANDYTGKGLSGGRIIVVPPEGTTFKAEENIIVGNTVLYGATGGEAFFRGIAGERFCVRNSGATAVVEGTGDHCAEYMTGGRILVLGKVGRNFAAGMSGGIAYVLDTDGNFEYFCNKGMVEIAPVRDFDDQEFIIELLKKYMKHTGSSLAKNIIDQWYQYLPKFVKVTPFEYKRALQEQKIEQIDLLLRSIREEEQIKESY